MERINREKFATIHRKIRESFIFELSKTLNQDAMRHIQRGFIVRFSMMESALITLDSEIGNSVKPLSSYLSVELSLLLNAYYLNLTGSLDNFAWALNYHLKLFSPVDETALRDQRKIQIVGDDFLKALKGKGLQKLADELKNMESWYRSVKKFRNPAAHNIPLFVPRSILTEEDAEQHRKLDIEAGELMREGKHDEGSDKMFESFEVGKHYPVFITEFPENKVFHLPKQINEDHENWLKITEIVFNYGFNTELSPDKTKFNELKEKFINLVNSKSN